MDETHSNSESSGAGSQENIAEFHAICEEEPSERCEAQMEERAMNGDSCMEIAVPNAAEGDTEIARNSLVRRPTPASQTGDGQARRRVLKRYKEDASGQWVKGRAGDGCRWLPEPGAATFPTLELAMEHERHKTVLRRNSWANLRGEVTGTRKAVTQESALARLHQTKESEEMWRSV